MLVFRLNKINLLATFVLENPYLVCIWLFVFSITHAKAATLEALINDAVVTHPTVRAQMASASAADLGIEIAHWQFYPTPSISAEGLKTSAKDPIYQGDDHSISLSIEQPLWTGGRLTASLDQANAKARFTQYEVAIQQQKIAMDVLQAYVDWYAAFLQIKAREGSLATHQRLFDFINRRVTQGASAANDLVLAKGRLALAESQLLAATVEESRALAQLEQLVGASVNADQLANKVAKPRVIATSQTDTLAQILLISPDIQAALAKVDMANADVAKQNAQLQPEFYLRFERQFGSYTNLDYGAHNRLFIGTRSQFGPGLSSFTTAKQTRLQYHAALANVEARELEITQQAMMDFALLEAIEQRLPALQVNQETAQQVLSSQERQFQVGRKTWLDVLNAVRDLVQAELELVDTQVTQILVTWRLSIAMHRNTTYG